MSPTACVFFSEHPFVGFACIVHCLDVCSLGNDPLVTPSSLRLCTRPLRHCCHWVHLFNSLLWADSCPQKLIGWRATPSVTVLGDGALRGVVKVKWGRLGGTWVREDWCPCKVSQVCAGLEGSTCQPRRAAWPESHLPAWTSGFQPPEP